MFSLKTANLNYPITDYQIVTNQYKPLTYKQLSNRSLVKQTFKKVFNVLMLGKRNTVKQYFGKIERKIYLYVKHRNFSPFQLKFDRIPPQNIDILLRLQPKKENNLDKNKLKVRYLIFVE